MGGGRGKGKGKGRGREEKGEGLCILFGSVSWLYFHELHKSWTGVCSCIA